MTDILKDINYLSYIGAFSKWILLSLLLSGVILFLCGYFGLFKRNNKIAKILTWFYYLLIPAYFIIFALKIAPIHNSQKEINSVIESNQALLNEYTSEFLDHISKNNLSIDSSSVQDVITNFITDESLSKNNNVKIGKRIIGNFKKKIEKKFLTKISEKIIAKKALKIVPLDKKSTRKIINLSFDELFNEGELVKIFQTQVNRIFRSIYKSILIVFLLGLLIPIIEIIIAKSLKY